MKLFFTILLFACLTCIGLAQTSQYQVFTGKLGNMDATLHMHQAGDKIFGYIWFQNNQWPMHIMDAYPVGHTDSTQMGASIGKLSLVMTGKLDETQYKGTCELGTEGKPSKKAPFQLTATDIASFSKFNHVFADESGKLPPQFKNESESHFFASTVWPDGESNTTLLEPLKNQLAKLSGMNQPPSDAQIYLKTSGADFIDTWNREIQKMPTTETAEMGLSLSQELDTRAMVMFENAKLITLAAFYNSYTGGAHGNYSTSTVSLLKDSGKVLALTDVLTPAGINALPAILDAMARVQFGVSNRLPLDQNGFNVTAIKPSGNFYVTSSGIGFLYPPYELRSFADGEITLQVPAAVLANYWQPAFKK